MQEIFHQCTRASNKPLSSNCQKGFRYSRVKPSANITAPVCKAVNGQRERRRRGSVERSIVGVAMLYRQTHEYKHWLRNRKKKPQSTKMAGEKVRQMTVPSCPRSLRL